MQGAEYERMDPNTGMQVADDQRSSAFTLSTTTPFRNPYPILVQESSQSLLVATYRDHGHILNRCCDWRPG